MSNRNLILRKPAFLIVKKKMTAILGIKGNMTNRYNLRGQRVPVTILQVDPNVVVAVNGQKALIGLGTQKKVKKPQSYIVTKVGFLPRFTKEVKKEGEIKVGDKITVGVFALGDAVKVTGTTKGHGFAGGIKRWGFHGGPKTHGQSDRHRAPGSIGQGTTPGRVLKGKKMAGHYGNKKITVTGLEVIEIDEQNNQLLIKGAIPGAKNGFVVIEKTGKVKKYVAPPEEKPKEDEVAGGEPRPEGRESEGPFSKENGTKEPKETQGEETKVEEKAEKSEDKKEEVKAAKGEPRPNGREEKPDAK